MTAQNVAEWMVGKLHSYQYLEQHVAVFEIEQEFGNDFTYLNSRGSLAIAKGVLDEFNRLTGDTVVWERGRRLWRLRESHDEPGRMQR